MLPKIATLSTIAAGMLAAGFVLSLGGDSGLRPSPVEPEAPSRSSTWDRVGVRLRDAATVDRAPASATEAEARLEPLALRAERGLDTLLAGSAFASIEAGELGVRAAIDPGTDRGAIDALRLGKAAAAITTRPPTQREAQDGLADYLVGHWAAVLVVHPDNPLRNLSSSQCRQLLSGQVDDWSELGGRPGPVQLVLPPAGQIATMITRAMLPGDKLGGGDKERDPAERLRKVREDPLAVTVVALPLARSQRATTLAIDMVRPDPDSVRLGQYRQTLPLHFVHGHSPDARVQQLAQGLRQDAIARLAPDAITPAAPGR